MTQAHASIPSVDPDTKAEVRRGHDPATRLAKGGWTSGGGEGVACFTSTEVRRASINETGQITAEGRLRIQSLVLLDAWEARNRYRMHSPVTISATGETVYLDPYVYLVRLLERRHRIAPYFIYKIQEAILLIRQRDIDNGWDDISPLPKIEDSGPLREDLPENCQRVQLAVRYSRSQGDGTLPQVFVDMDKDLVERMWALNGPSERIIYKAGLTLHEALYVAAAELGALNSAQVRDMTMFFLSQDLDQELSAAPERMRLGQFANFFIDRGFKDIMRLFVPQVSRQARALDREALVGSSARLTRLHQQAVAVYSQRVARLSAEERANLSQSDHSNGVFGVLIELGITQREAFLLFAYNSWNMGHLSRESDMNPQRMLLPEVDGRPIAQFVCSYIASATNLARLHAGQAQVTGTQEIARGYTYGNMHNVQRIRDMALSFCIDDGFVNRSDLQPQTAVP